MQFMGKMKVDNIEIIETEGEYLEHLKFILASKDFMLTSLSNQLKTIQEKKARLTELLMQHCYDCTTKERECCSKKKEALVLAFFLISTSTNQLFLSTSIFLGGL